MKTTWHVDATVLRVIDGDTILVDADLGWRVHMHTAVRIDGINADEIGTQAGAAAKVFAESLLKPGDAISVISKKWLGEFEKYGRILGDLSFNNGARDFAQEMLTSHHAVPWDGTGNKPE